MTTTPLCLRKAKGTGKKTHTQTPGEEEAIEVLSNHLKGEARVVQYNLELAILVEYRNLHIPNLKGPPNTDDHLAYLSVVKDVSWSYPAKGNLITARQYYQDLKASKDPEAIEAGDSILWEKRMMGIPQEMAKAGPVKCRYVIFVLHSVEGEIIDACDSDNGLRLEHWAVWYREPGLLQKGWKERFPYLQRPERTGEGDARVLPILFLRHH